MAVTETNLIQEVRSALARGWCLTILNGKKPILSDWPTRRLTEDQIINHVMAGGNIGVVTGAASGLLVVDFDELDSPEAIDLLDRLPETVTAQTGGGGRHLFYRLPEGAAFGNTSGKLGPRIDTRGNGGQVVLAGSVHPETGAFYEWAAGKSPDDIEVAEAPEWLAVALTAKPVPAPAPKLPWARPPTDPACDGRELAYRSAALFGEVETVRGAAQGTRNATLNSSALKLAALGVDEATISERLTEAGLEVGLGGKEIAATIRSGIEAGKRAPRDIPDRPRAKAAGAGQAEWPEIEVKLPVNELPEGWLSTPIPPLDSAFAGGVMPVNMITLLQATGGAGKSFLALQMAVSIATGIELIPGLRPVTAGRVFLVNFEDDFELIHRRLQRIWRAFGLAPELGEVLRRNLRILTPTEFQSLDPSGGIVPGPGLKALSRELADYAPRLVILDPLANLIGGNFDENDNSAAASFMALLRGAMPSGAAIVLCAHVSKAEKSSSGSARGASAFEAAARMTLPLKLMDSSEAKSLGIGPEDARRYVTLAVDKTNHCLAQPPIYLCRNEDGVLQVFDRDSARAAAASSKETQIREALPRAVAGYPEGVGPREATGKADRAGRGKLFREALADMLGLPCLKGGEIEGPINDLLMSGELIRKPAEDNAQRLILAVPGEEMRND